MKDLPAIWETQVREDTVEKRMATLSSIPAWNSHGQRNLAGFRPWGYRKKSEKTGS